MKVIPPIPEARPCIFELMGQSLSVPQIYLQIQRVACTDFAVIVQGEADTGKELVARLIHEHSHWANKLFVVLD